MSQHYFLKMIMIDNKTILIAGLVIGGIVALYLTQTEIASAIFGGLVGYLSKDVLTVQHEEVTPIKEEEEDPEYGSDSEIA